MRCEFCRQDNPSDARFCGGCGAPLVRNDPGSPDHELAGRIPPDLLPRVQEPSFLPVVLEGDTYGSPRKRRDGSRLPWLGLMLLVLTLAGGGGYALGRHQAAGWSLDLSANTAGAQIGDTVTLTARANRDVGPTPYELAIVDQTTGQMLNSCGRGTQCTGTVTRYTATRDTFVAKLDNGEPQSRPVSVTWAGSWTVTLSVNHTEVGVNSTVRLSAETNRPVGGSSENIYILDQGSGTVIASCTTGTSCSGNASSAGAGNTTYIAEVASQPGTSPLAQSDPVSVTWDDWSVSLSSDQTQVQDGALVTLTAQANDDLGSSPYSLVIVNQTTGQPVGSCGQGTTCTAQVSSQSDGAISYVARVGDNQAWSSPLTVTWGTPQAIAGQSSNTQADLVAPVFVDDSTGWIAGNDGAILATTDGGTTWTAEQSGTGATLHGLAFPDRSTGWAVGENGTILHTADGGGTWNSQASNTTAFLHGVAFTDDNNGWAVGDSGTILHTTDGGATWTAESSGSSQNLRGVAFLDSENGWVVGEGGTILVTMDGGINWTVQNSPVNGTLAAVKFTDVDNGWIVGDYGTILHTTDGGATWANQTNPNTATLIAVAFPGANDGWAVGNGGTLLHTSDDGATWNTVTTNTGSIFWGVAAPDSQHVWAVGAGGTILHITGYGS